jgi:prevent-host-death family protein
MRFVTISELKNETSSIVHRVEEGDSVVVVRHGKPRAAVIPIKEEELDQLLFESSPAVHQALREALSDLKAGRSVTLREYLRGRRSA